MAVCPICNGRGSVYNALGNFYEDCGRCQGTGKVRVEGEPMTNEEWFCNLSTEEKAEWLSKHLHCGDCNIENRMCAGTYSGCKETLIKWLKEKHHG